MSRPEEVQIYFGYDGILYADSIRKKLKDLKETEARIEAKFKELEAELERWKQEKSRILGRGKDEA